RAKDDQSSRGTGFALAVDVAEANKPVSATELTKRPVSDEWGIYDPQRAGLAAVFRQLSNTDDAEPQHHLKARPAAAKPSTPASSSMAEEGGSASRPSSPRRRADRVTATSTALAIRCPVRDDINVNMSASSASCLRR